MDQKNAYRTRETMTEVQSRLYDHLSQFVSDHKRDFVEKVLANRTRYVTVVLENIFQSQNASAVIRTCECMGLQDIHVVENTAKYQLNVRVLKGSDKWLNIERYRTKLVNNTETCFATLRQNDYRIMLADPSEDGIPIDEIDVTANKLAFVFGNELRGVSDYALKNCDQKVRIPMFGFTESLNISVSAAICLTTILPKLRASGTAIGLSEEEKKVISLNWFKKIVKRSDIVEREFLRTIQ
jgi:tRNA (guanosine-2'-O-)-methyltransferase